MNSRLEKVFIQAIDALLNPLNLKIIVGVPVPPTNEEFIPSSIKVLLVDDDKSQKIHVQLLLGSCHDPHFHIDWADSFEQGLEKIKSAEYDIALIDYDLSCDEHNGIELIQESRKVSHTPMILLTASQDQAADLKALKAGAIDYLLKMEINHSILKRAIIYAIRISSYINQLKSSNQELDEFARLVSHDLKEPLRGIRQYTERLLDTNYDNTQKDAAAHRVLQLTEKSESLIESLYEYSRVGRTHDSLGVIDLQPFLDAALMRLSHLIERKNVKIHLPQRLPCAFFDYVWGETVFYNLISNAIKYNTHPHPEIHITSTLLDDKIQICVKDNGLGMTEDEVEIAFLLFKRLHTSDIDVEGTGVGLSLVQKVIHKCQGTLHVESTPQQGSAFYFQLSLV